MGTVATGCDSIRFFHTGAASAGVAQSNPEASLGKFRSSTRIETLSAVVGGGVDNLTIDRVDENCGVGQASIWAHDADAVVFRPPDNAAGVPVVVPAGATRTVFGADRNKWAVVTRDAGPAPLSGSATIDLSDAVGTSVAFDMVKESESAAGVTRHRCQAFRNTSATDVADVRSWIATAGTETTLAAAIGTGVASAVCATALWDWAGGFPGDGGGFAVFNETKSEVAYFSEIARVGRVPTTLTLPAAGRDLYGETVGGAGVGVAWSIGDVLKCVPPVRIGYEAPTAQPDGQFTDTTGDDTTPPGGVVFDHPYAADDSSALLVATLAAGNMGARWIEQKWPAATSGRAANRIVLFHRFAV